MKQSPSTKPLAHRPAQDIRPSVKPSRRRRHHSRDPSVAFEKIAFKKLNKKWHKAFIQAHGFSEPASQKMVMKDEFENDPDSIFDQLWDERDERMLQARWDSTMLSKELNVISCDHPKLLLLWKLSFRLFRKDPLDLFTRDSDLDFNDDSNGDHLQSNPHGLWSEDFCDKLIKIMAHPMSKESSLMLFLLKWAVICRTDDRRRLKEKDTEMLDSIHCYIDPTRHSDPFGIRHEEFQQHLWESGGWPTAEAELLSMIWKKSTVHHLGLVLFDGIPYQVTTSDLDAVIDALGASVGSVTLGYNVDHEALTRLTAEDHPAGPDDFRPAFKKAWFASVRITVRHGRMGGEDDAPHQKEETDDSLFKESSPDLGVW